MRPATGVGFSAYDRRILQQLGGVPLGVSLGGVGMDVDGGLATGGQGTWRLCSGRTDAVRAR
jgi:hypothetical protein